MEPNTKPKIINLLIVEENEDALNFIKKVLSADRYNLIVIESGIDAYHYLLKPEIKPDIVLLDNKLPGMDGLEILEKICAVTNDYSFIFLSIDSSIKTVVKAMKAGALDFVVKSPELKNELSEKIEKVFELHLNKIERKKIEEELIKAKERAEESDRLKSAFLKNMSHEIRTPLNAIVGFSHLMAKPDQSPEKLKKFADFITTNSNKLVETITNVIEISQIHANQIKAIFTEIDIVSFLKNSVNSFTEKAKDQNINFTLNINIPDKEYFIFSDIKKLNKTIVHIIDNAFKFTAKGSIVIDCNLVEPSTVIEPEVTERSRSAEIQISITDTGIGIAMEMQNKIFELFRQAETGMIRQYGGNGLGLPIAKAYIELLNGTISLKSEINKGTTFNISLPVYKSNMQTGQKGSNKLAYSINTILIAEDEYSNYQYLLEFLGETGIKILYAQNGQEALDMCRANSSIDLILMDIKMPIMDGYTAAKLIKEFRPEIPIIAQTAFALESEKEQFAGVFDDWITKPIDEDELTEILKWYIDK